MAEHRGPGVAHDDVFDLGVDPELTDLAEFGEILEDVFGALDLALPGAAALDVPDDVVGPERTEGLAVSGAHRLKTMV